MPVLFCAVVADAPVVVVTLLPELLLALVLEDAEVVVELAEPDEVEVAPAVVVEVVEVVVDAAALVADDVADAVPVVPVVQQIISASTHALKDLKLLANKKLLPLTSVGTPLENWKVI